MRVLHLSAYDLFGGAAKAAFRLHQALRTAGVTSAMLVRRKDSDDPDVFAPKGAARLWAKVQRRMERALFLRGCRGEFSPGVLPDMLARRVRESRPDVLHAHWVSHSFLRLETLVRTGLPVVWTMHDMWPFTGGCHYAGACRGYLTGCGWCPLLGARARSGDASARGVARRRELFGSGRVTLIAPSRWMADCASRSLAAKGCDARRIPYCVNTDVFSPRARREARERLGLPLEGRLLLAGGMGGAECGRKGLPEFLAALDGIRAGEPRPRVAVFGTQSRGCAERNGVVVQELGRLDGDDAMADAYASADLFVAPSREDNLPNTVLESLATGTPVVAFAVGGIPDLIEDGENGCLVPPGDVGGLTRAMMDLLRDDGRREACSRRARELALARYSPGGVAEAHRALYSEILARG